MFINRFKNKEYKSKKPGVFIFSMGIIITSIFMVVGVAAYLIDVVYQNNELSPGNVKVEITEDFAAPKELVPGAVIKKDVKVENTGNNPCAVRVFVSYSSSAAKNSVLNNIDTNLWIKQDEEPNGVWYYYKKALAVSGDESITASLWQNSYPFRDTETDASQYTGNIKISPDADIQDLKGFNIYVYAEAKDVPKDIGEAEDKTMTEAEIEQVWDVTFN